MDERGAACYSCGWAAPFLWSVNPMLVPSELTEVEISNIEALKKEGKLSSTCPRCHVFWLRDYAWPIRKCPGCGRLKEWADPNLADPATYIQQGE